MDPPKNFDFDGNFLNLILKQTSNICQQMIAKLDNNRILHDSSAYGDGLTLDEKLSNLCESVSQSLDQMQILNLLQNYHQILETSITKTNLRHNRLKEEVEWLGQELEYFKSKKLEEEIRAEELQKQIDHLTFVYCQRKNRSQEFLSKGLCWIKKELNNHEDAKPDDCKQIDILSKLKNQLPLRKYNPNHDDHSEIDYYDLISSNNSHDNAFRDLVLEPNENVNRKDNRNVSNSTKLTLSELRQVMLGANEVEHKNPTDTGRKSTVASVKTKPIRRPLIIQPEPGEMFIVKQDQDVLKQSMKLIISKLKDESSSNMVVADTIESYVDVFARSERRTEQMNEFLALVKEHSSEESRSPGIALCWIAIMALSKYEMEFKHQRKQNLKQLGRRKSSIKDSHEIVRRKINALEEVRHADVVNDICRLLTVVSHLYKTRGELQRSAESLKLILKWRRSTKTLNTESVASVLNNLSVIHASLGNHGNASSFARKALNLRREMLTHDSGIGDHTKTELALAKQATNLALILLSKHRSEQKRLRYSRFPFRDLNEIPALLKEALQIECTIQDRLLTDSTVSTDQACNQRPEPSKPTVIGDSYNPLGGIKPSSAMNSILEMLVCSRNGMAIFYLCTKKWSKALKQLNLNLATLNQIAPQDLSRPSTDDERSWRLLKLTCIKCLIYANRMLGQGDKQSYLFERLMKLDPFSQMNHDIAEEDILRICQNTLFTEN